MVKSSTSSEEALLQVWLKVSEPERVIEAFTDANALVSWWSETAETDPKTGGYLHLAWPAMGWDLRGEYLALEATSVNFTWSWDHEDLPVRVVEVEAVPQYEGVGLTIRHDAGSEAEAQSYVDGWIHFLPRLEEFLLAGTD